LQGFAAWSPDALQGAGSGAGSGAEPAPAARGFNPGAAAPPHFGSTAQAPSASTARTPEPAPEPAPDVEALVKSARQSGYQDGYRDGMAALDAFKQSFAQQMSAQIGELVHSFDAAFRGLESELAQSVARSAVELARQVVRSEIAQRPEHIVQVAHDAMEALLLSARHVRVRVNPADLALVAEGAAAELQAREAQLLPDASIPRGGCTVDSDISSVDASLAARWQQVMAASGQASVWEDRRGGNEPAPADDDDDEGMPT